MHRLKRTQSSSQGMKFRAVISVDEDEIYIGELPNLPGCVSQGATREECLDNLKDAAKGYLASLKKHDEPIPPSIDEEVIEIDA